jgi:hypothetical protein
VKSLKCYQVNGWRLSQHYLSQRLKRQDFVKAVTQTGGIQAQVMSAAELAIWARTDGLLVQNVKSALWWGLRAYPNNPAARKAIKPQAKWTNPR